MKRLWFDGYILPKQLVDISDGNLKLILTEVMTIPITLNTAEHATKLELRHWRNLNNIIILENTCIFYSIMASSSSSLVLNIFLHLLLSALSFTLIHTTAISTLGQSPHLLFSPTLSSLSSTYPFSFQNSASPFDMHDRNTLAAPLTTFPPVHFSHSTSFLVLSIRFIPSVNRNIIFFAISIRFRIKIERQFY